MLDRGFRLFKPKLFLIVLLGVPCGFVSLGPRLATLTSTRISARSLREIERLPRRVTSPGNYP